MRKNCGHDNCIITFFCVWQRTKHEKKSWHEKVKIKRNKSSQCQRVIHEEITKNQKTFPSYFSQPIAIKSCNFHQNDVYYFCTNVFYLKPPTKFLAQMFLFMHANRLFYANICLKMIENILIFHLTGNKFAIFFSFLYFYIAISSGMKNKLQNNTITCNQNDLVNVSNACIACGFNFFFYIHIIII